MRAALNLETYIFACSEGAERCPKLQAALAGVVLPRTNLISLNQAMFLEIRALH